MEIRKGKIPADYSDFKTLVITHHDVAKNPDGRQLPTAYEKAKTVESSSAESRSQTGCLTSRARRSIKNLDAKYVGRMAVDCYRRLIKHLKPLRCLNCKKARGSCIREISSPSWISIAWVSLMDSKSLPTLDCNLSLGFGVCDLSNAYARQVDSRDNKWVAAQ
jgi:hypothetical protein